MDVEQLLSLAGSVCGNEVWEDIIPYLRSERRANSNIASDKVLRDAITTAEIRLLIYNKEVAE